MSRCGRIRHRLAVGPRHTSCDLMAGYRIAPVLPHHCVSFHAAHRKVKGDGGLTQGLHHGLSTGIPLKKSSLHRAFAFPGFRKINSTNFAFQHKAGFWAPDNLRHSRPILCPRFPAQPHAMSIAFHQDSPIIRFSRNLSFQ